MRKNHDLAGKRYLRNRTMEILDAYLMHPDEAYCEVTLSFRKKNGETQTKHLRWRAEPDKAETDDKTCLLCAVAGTCPHYDVT